MQPFANEANKKGFIRFIGRTVKCVKVEECTVI